MLNAKQHDREATIVAEAGRKGAVTVATNMAGRGTDIMLGGNVEFLADHELRGRGLDPVDTPEDYEKAWPEAVEQVKARVTAEHDEVRELGGLYVLGTERHESRRIDNQLRGRSGRQGDPGESRFYLSLGDDLMRLFNAAMVENFLTRFNIPEDVPIESKMVTNAIRSAQTQVEAQNFEIRKNVLKYDEVLNRQRTVIYDERRQVLEGADLHEQIRHMIDDAVEGYVVVGDRRGLRRGVGPRPALDRAQDPLPGVGDDRGARGGLGRRAVRADRASSSSRSSRPTPSTAYDLREERLGAETMRELERRVVLSVLDRKWREHLYEMDYLQEGIGLRAMAQRDPLVEYQREGFNMFAAMMDAIKEESVGYVFNLEVQVEDGRGRRGRERGPRTGGGQGPRGSAPAGPAAVHRADDGRRPERGWRRTTGARRRPAASTPTPRATRRAPAARARSTSAATATRGTRTADPATVMTPEELRDYSLAKPGAWPDEPWEGDSVAKVGSKIFAFLGSETVGAEVGVDPRGGR